MNLKELAERCRKFADPYRINDRENFRLEAINPGDVGDLTAEDKPRAKEALATACKPSRNCRGCFTLRIAGGCW